MTIIAVDIILCQCCLYFSLLLHTGHLENAIQPLGLNSCCSRAAWVCLSVSLSLCPMNFMLIPTLGLVMGLQFRHQRSKLYRQVAMGEKHLLSITQGKCIIKNILFTYANCFWFHFFLDMKPTVSNFLISCLVGIYIFQFYNGYTLFMLYFSSAVDCPHWQVSSGQRLVSYMIQIQYTVDREIFRF